MFPRLLLLLWLVIEAQCDGFLQNKENVEVEYTVECVRGHSVPISANDLPIPPRMEKGQVCRVEVEELAPFYSAAGYVVPKKFDCNFKYGHVVYYSNGNPILQHDVIRMSIYYDREQPSMVASVDLNVKILQDPTNFSSNHYASPASNSTVYYAGSKAPKLGFPLVPGQAMGGSKRWPIFGNLVTFNRTLVKLWSHDCQTALLMGYRYMHRKGDGPDTDYIPVELTIYQRNSDGSRRQVTKQGHFIRVQVKNAASLRKPVVEVVRSVNLLHIGGTLSVLPPQVLKVPKDSVPEEEYLDVKVMRIESTLKAQLLNLRDPTRPVMSFRISELRIGLIAMQYLEYSHHLEKVTKIHLKIVDPFNQESEQVILNIISHLQSAIQGTATFQVFTLPLYAHTGSSRTILQHNIQVIGYVDEDQIGVKIFRDNNLTSHLTTIPIEYQGSILVGGVDRGETFFPLTSLAKSLVVYECTKNFGGPSVDRLQVGMVVQDVGYLENRRKRDLEQLRKPIFDLSVRIFRLYDSKMSEVLKSRSIMNIDHRSFRCLTSEMLLDPVALLALRSDLVDLIFDVKTTPSQGILVRKSTLPSYGQNYRELAQIRKNNETAFKSPFFDQSILSRFTFFELEAGEICYLNQRDDRMKDLFGLQQFSSHVMPSVYYEINIKKVKDYVLSQRMNPDQIIVMNETDAYVVISTTNLNFGSSFLDDNIGLNFAGDSYYVLPSEVVYEVDKAPRYLYDDEYEMNTTEDAGRLVSLESCKSHELIGDINLQTMLITDLRAIDPPSVDRFTQQQIDEGDIVYVPPNQDVGFDERMVAIEYKVSGPHRVTIYKKLLKLKIKPVDNQKPEIRIVQNVTVSRDEEIILNKTYVDFYDPDTRDKNLFMTVDKVPEFGQLTKEGTPVKVGDILTIASFEESLIKYKQSGTNVRKDSLALTISDGRQTSNSTEISIGITERKLLRPGWLKFVNNSIEIPENGTISLHESIFPQYLNLSGLTPNTDARFACGVMPTKGFIVNNKNKKITTFSTLNIREQQVFYKHGPTEIGTRSIFDFARIYDLQTFNSFSINFTIIPTNSKSPVIKSHAALEVNEGSNITLTPLSVTAFDGDTLEDDLVLFVLREPSWGEILVKSESAKELNLESLPSELRYKQSFNMRELKAGNVSYHNSKNAGGIEVELDSFYLQAFDGNFTSQDVQINVVIHATNDEVPYVRLLRHVSVPTGGKVVLTPHLLAVTDKDLPKDVLQIEFTKLPRYGNLYQYWKHGEVTKINVTSSPITQQYLAMLNILYLQDADLIPSSVKNLTSEVLVTDSFELKVSDGVHEVEKHSEVLIRGKNSEKPTLTLDSEPFILDGTPWKSLYSRPGGLKVEDLDSVPEDLIITIEKAPIHGILKRTPRIAPLSGSVPMADWIEDAWDFEEREAERNGHTRVAMTNAGSTGGLKAEKDLYQQDRFTKRQLMLNRIHYVYTGNYTDAYVEDNCELKLTDGDFETETVNLRIRIRKTSGFTDKSRLLQQQDLEN
ncbi:hypothetical protein Ciccas_000387 [Cichlidogyrus casuarinus]|uniref:FRAS1-related extracellular matrix protein N-terminal domain-containing protein n=1 Tax=Cichlidogyrus casuarinus TaxID=1844966 RepID=A0ABD2QN35_9PLAT